MHSMLSDFRSGLLREHGSYINTVEEDEDLEGEYCTGLCSGQFTRKGLLSRKLGAGGQFSSEEHLLLLQRA